MRLALISLLMIPLAVGCGTKCGEGTHNEGGTCVADKGGRNLADSRPSYEYKIETVNDLTWDLTMKRLGEAGWELVFARRARNPITDSYGYESIFKREKLPMSDEQKMKALGYAE